MIKLKVNDADRILIIEMKGKISEADIDDAVDALQEQYPAIGVHVRGGGAHSGFSVLAGSRGLGEGRQDARNGDHEDDRRCRSQGCGHR
jgi:hypothetical protein